MMKLVAVFASLATSFFLCGIALADPLTLKGFHLGMARETIFLTRTGALPCSDQEDGKSQCVSSGSGVDIDTIAGEKTLRWIFKFDKAQALEAISVAIPSKHSDQVLTALIQRYGKPHKVQTGSVQNKLGGTFKQSTASWIDGDTALSFITPGTSLEEAVLGISSVAAAMSDTVRDTNKRAKDI